MSKLLINAIKEPTLLVDLKKVDANIAWMKSRADKNDVVLRPHFKTHQSHAIGQIFRKKGVQAITVSSVKMAQYFANDEWKDILIAFPVNWKEIDEINALAASIDLHLMVDSPETIQFLSRNLSSKVGIWLKIDTGLNRVGIWWQDKESILRNVKEIEKHKNLVFQGILTHAGHSYFAKSSKDLLSISKKSKNSMVELKEFLVKNGFRDTKASIGDTPGCKVLPEFKGIDEIRPGNFVFYDIEQWNLGVCDSEEIAVVVACPVVAKNEDRQQITIFGGAIHLAKETITFEGRNVYGFMAKNENFTFSEVNQAAPVIKTTQEHGVIQADQQTFMDVNIGDIVFIFPVHSCLVVQALKDLRVMDGEIIQTMNSCIS